MLDRKREKHALLWELAQLLARFIALIPAHPTTNNTNQVTVFMQHFYCEKSPHMQDQNKN